MATDYEFHPSYSARGGGLLLSQRFFREYQDLSNGQFQGTWNFVH